MIYVKNKNRTGSPEKCSSTFGAGEHTDWWLPWITLFSFLKSLSLPRMNPRSVGGHVHVADAGAKIDADGTEE